MFLSIFKKRSLGYGSSDGSPWVLNGMLRSFINNLLMKGGRQWLCFDETSVKLNGKMTQTEHFERQTTNSKNQREVKITSKLTVRKIVISSIQSFY